MKFRPWFCWCCFNILSVIQILAADEVKFGVRDPYKFLGEEKSMTLPINLAIRFQSRFLNDLTNRFTAPYKLEMLWNEGRVELTESLQLRKEGIRAFRGSFRYTLREYAISELPMVPWLKEKGSDLWQNTVSVLLDVFTDIGDRNVLPSPFHPEEGLLNFERPSGWRNLRKGVRLSVNNPYVFLSYPFKDAEGQNALDVSVRYYYSHFREHRLELVNQIPLNNRWALGFGVAAKSGQWIDRQDERNIFFSKNLSPISGTLAIQGKLFGGVMYGAFVAPTPRVEFGYFRSW